jgi:hypothetical protein
MISMGCVYKTGRGTKVGQNLRLETSRMRVEFQSIRESMRAAAS